MAQPEINGISKSYGKKTVLDGFFAKMSDGGLKIPKIKKRKALILPLIALMLFSGCSSTLPQENKSGYFRVNDYEHVYSKERDEIFSINPTPFTNRRIQHIYGNYAIVTEDVTPDFPNKSFYIKAKTSMTFPKNCFMYMAWKQMKTG